ncbi:MAG TPA: alpha/beta family hydrolase [Steroidobacteraceae bacterium]|nr:alpha/beta family hydrolase [Steroidobacteraceae bacterium]
MATADSQSVEIAVDEATRVSGILIAPRESKACFVLAHGAGAGMRHPFMAKLADDLAALRIATLRYQFPYMERRGKRPDTPAVCHAAVRAAVAAAATLVPSLPLIAGGKSFGGRMTSQAQSTAPLPGVRGLVFLGFPLHPPKQPSDQRGGHLAQVQIPMLFLQGARDAFAAPELLNPLVKRLGGLVTLRLLRDADHSFHVPARSGVGDDEIHAEMLAALESWVESVAARPAISVNA